MRPIATGIRRDYWRNNWKDNAIRKPDTVRWDHTLRALLRAELDRGPDFLRLANALSALYPKESEEKRLLNAMLLTVPK
jgi:hypothetical protein